MSVHPTTFEELEAWKQARTVTRQVYRLTRETTLRRDFGLTGQIQRASVSSMSNVAEGFERLHLQEKLQFYNVAHGSAGEIRSLLYVIEDNYPELAAEALELRTQANRVGKLVAGLIRSTEDRKRSTNLTAKISAMLSALLG